MDVHVQYLTSAVRIEMGLWIKTQLLCQICKNEQDQPFGDVNTYPIDPPSGGGLGIVGGTDPSIRISVAMNIFPRDMVGESPLSIWKKIRTTRVSLKWKIIETYLPSDEKSNSWLEKKYPENFPTISPATSI